jgi:hypothetical protein
MGPSHLEQIRLNTISVFKLHVIREGDAYILLVLQSYKIGEPCFELPGCLWAELANRIGRKDI